MKLPDKIYVLMDESTGFLSHTFTNVPCEYEGTKQDIPFIRKDALLKWAKAKHMELDPPQNERDFGRIEAVEELIKHIESL